MHDWLERREPAAPSGLVTQMRAAFDALDADPEDLPSAIGEAALACLTDALAKGNSREAALDLLAADALLTYGCEAAAEAAPGALERFANEYGAVRLAELLPASRPKNQHGASADISSVPSGPSKAAPSAAEGPRGVPGDIPSPPVRGERVGVRGAESVALHMRRLAATAQVVASELAGRIGDVAEQVIRTFERGGKLLFCGNGGSAADAQHLATEYVVRFRCTRRPLPAIALTTDTSLLTAAANDLGFDQVFARQVQALARAGDFLFLHSTSGNSANLLAAAHAARERGVTTAALLAQGGGELKDVVDYAIVLPTDDAAHAQEVHLAIGHAICDVVENTLDG